MDKRFIFTVVGFADMDDGVHTFTRIVESTYEDAWPVAVAAEIADNGMGPDRELLRQATEITTLLGACVDAGSLTVDKIEQGSGVTLDLDPDEDRLYDLKVYRRSRTPTEDDRREWDFYWWDDEANGADGAEQGPFTTYSEALSDRYESVSY